MAFEDLNFDNFSGNSNSGSNNSDKKRVYEDESVRSAFVRKSQSAEFRVSGRMLATRAAFVKAKSSRVSKAGRSYTPSALIPAVGHLPGFEGRCILANKVQDVRINPHYLFEVFDFRFYHPLQTEHENYVIHEHKQCLARGPQPNGNACEYCDVGSPRVVGGWRFMGMSENRAKQLLMHDTHIMQFPLSDSPVEFFGQKVQSLSASCSECGHEVFSERKLQMLSAEQVVTEVVKKKHTCPSCGHVGKLKESCVARNQSGETVDVQRGDITCKNIEIKVQPGKKGNTYVFNSDLLPFESVEKSLLRKGVSDEAVREVLERPFSWEKVSAPYGIDPEEFDDFEKYVEVITNKQLRDLNNVYFGWNRNDHQITNPFFQREGFSGNSRSDDVPF